MGSHRVPRTTIACLFACSLYTSLHAQEFADHEYLIDTWETADGLPENSATAMVQMADGFLVFGTFAGIVKFDGIFFGSLNDPTQAAARGAGVVNLHLDRQSRLWVSDYDHLSLFDDHDVRQFDESHGWTGDLVKSFAERSNGEFLLTTYDSQIFEYSRGTFHELPRPGNPDVAYFGFVDQTDHWWIVQRSFVGRWNGTAWVSEFEVPAHRALGTAPARDGGIWLLFDQELRKIRNGKEVMRRTLSEHTGGPWQMHEDSAGNVWVATYNNGVCRIDPAGHVRRWTIGSGLKRPSTRFVFEDRERNIWVGTSGGGLVRFKPRRFLQIGARQGLPPVAITSSCPDLDGSTLIATYGEGLFRWDGAALTPVHWPGLPNAKELYLQSVLVDRIGRTWVGAFGRGLFLLDDQGGRQIDRERIGGRNVIALFEDSGDRVWISSGTNIAVYEDDEFRIVPQKANEFGGVRSFVEDAQHRIWLIGDQGVYRSLGDQFEPVVFSPDTAIGVVRGIAADLRGAVWVFGHEMLGYWDETRQSFQRLHVPFAYIHSLVQDAGGHYWLTTSEGIVRVAAHHLHSAIEQDRELTTYQIFDRSDGVESLDFISSRQPTHSTDAHGRLWFTASSGVVMADPRTLRLNERPPQSQITALRAFKSNHEDNSQGLTFDSVRSDQYGLSSQSDSYVIPAGSDRIEIHFTALSFTAPEKVQFETLLDGRDRAWRPASGKRVETIERLAPGDYVFRVRAANNDGVWNENDSSVAFTLAPFYWQATWFRGFVLLLAASTIAGMAWWAGHARHQRRVRSNEWFRRVVEASPNALAAVDANGRIYLVNQQMQVMFGYTNHELIGQRVELLMPERSHDRHVTDRQALAQNPATRAMGVGRELFGRRRDGSEFPVEIGLSSVRGPDGELVLASILDMTERQLAAVEADRHRTELAHLGRVTMLGELSASFAHELNQPLTAILSNAQAAQRFLAKKYVNVQEVKEILGEIVEDNNRASEVIRRMRALFRKGELTFEPIDVSVLIDLVVRLLHSDKVLRHVHVNVDGQPGMPLVLADTIQIQQVILNLLLNAFDAMEQTPPAERRVDIRVESLDSMVQVAVCDTGSGLSGDTLDRVFKPFFTTKGDGLGMGLSICRSILEAHGGNIYAVNNPLRGATFTFTLPAVKRDSMKVAEGES